MGFDPFGIGNSASSTSSTDTSTDINISPAAQDGALVLNNIGEGAINFTDAGAVEQALSFASDSQAYQSENFSSTLGLVEAQNKYFLNAVDELAQANQSVYETALASANDTRNLAFDNIKSVTGKIASIAQTQTGDIKPMVTNAIIGLSVVFGIFFIGGRVFK